MVMPVSGVPRPSLGDAACVNLTPTALLLRGVVRWLGVLSALVGLSLVLPKRFCSPETGEGEQSRSSYLTLHRVQ